ncbi:MAG: type II secretion system protein GspJ [Bdellovibrionota bacterium]
MIKQKGFTLLEIILALSILSTIGIITINILSDQIATRQKLGDLNTDAHSLDAALNRISKDLQGAYLPDSKNTSLNLSYRPVAPQFYLKQENLIFFTFAFQSYISGSNQSNQAFVRYYTDTNPNDSSKRILYRVVDTDLVDSIEGNDIGLSQILLDDVESFHVEFWDGNKYVTDWDTQANDTQNKLPKLVKVHLSAYSVENKGQAQLNNKDWKKKINTLDSIVYLINAQGQQEANKPTWAEYKWN